MTISIVIPSFNGERFIEETLLSAINQVRKADEIIVHDDNSTDSTKNICLKYSKYIKFYQNPNGPSGFVNGWNRAITYAKGEFISILHQDDLLHPLFLQEAEKALRNNPEIKHLFTLCNYIDENGIITSDSVKFIIKEFSSEVVTFSGLEYIRSYQKSYNDIIHIHRCPGVITHRSIFDNGCLYNPEAGHIADDDFFYRVGLYTTVMGIIKPLAAYRIHDKSETGRIGEINLVKRLSNDYIFQLRQWNNSTWITGKEYEFFVDNALRYSKRLLGYGIKNRQIELVKSAIHNLKKLNDHVPSDYKSGIEKLSLIYNLLIK